MRTAHARRYNERPQILAALIKARGRTPLPRPTADVNLRVINDSLDLSPLQLAMRTSPKIQLSWSRENRNKRRVYALLVASGATIPPDGADADNDAYLCKVRAAGGFPAYEKAHRMRLTATCARVVFPRLPVTGAPTSSPSPSTRATTNNNLLIPPPRHHRLGGVREHGVPLEREGPDPTFVGLLRT